MCQGCFNAEHHHSLHSTPPRSPHSHHDSPRNLSPREDDRRARSRNASPSRTGYLTPNRAASREPRSTSTEGRSLSRSASPTASMGPLVPAGRGGYNGALRSVSSPPPDSAGRGGYNVGRPSGSPPATVPRRHVSPPQHEHHTTAKMHHSSAAVSGAYRPVTKSVSPAPFDHAGRGGYNATPPTRSQSVSPPSTGTVMPMGRVGYSASPHHEHLKAAPHRSLTAGIGGQHHALPKNISQAQPDGAGRGGYNASLPGPAQHHSPAAPEIPFLAGRGGYNRSASSSSLPDRRGGDGASPSNRTLNRSPAASQGLFPAGRGGYNSSLS